VPRSRLVATFAAAYALVWVGAVLTAIGFALAIDTEGQDTGDLGPIISGFLIGAFALNVAWMCGAFAVLSRHGHVGRSLAGAVITPGAVIAALILSLPLGIALAITLPAAAAWWATDPYR
jgi:hypothetical protein